MVVFSSFGELGGVCGGLWWFVVVCGGFGKLVGVCGGFVVVCGGSDKPY